MPKKSTKKRKLSSPPKEPQQSAQKSGSCLFCGVLFEEDDSKLSNAERLKFFEATCMFLNVSTEEHTWNFEEELFPFCTSCVCYVQEFGALCEELEIVHCKIGRVVENIKLIVSSSSSESPEPSKSKRTRKGSGSAGHNSKLAAFKEQLLATLKIGEETEGGGQDGENGSSSFRKESLPSPVKHTERDTETVGISSSEDKESTNQRSEEPEETAQEDEGNSEEVGTVDDSDEEEDEFIAYVKEQLEKRKAQGLANDDDEIIPVDHSIPIPKIEADDVSKDVMEDHSESDEIQPSTTETINAARPKLPIKEATVNSPSVDVDAADKSSHGFGTVVGERYEKYINTPKPILSMSAVTSDGFLYGAVAVRKKGSAYQCSLCPKFVVMHDKDLILDHIEMVHVGTDHWYPCEYCHESFRLVGQLHLHRKQQHPGMRDRKWTLMCSVCSKRFFSPEFATKHSDIDHKLASEKTNKVLRDLEAKGRALPEISEEIETNIHPHEDESHDNGISIEPMPFQLRPRKTRQTYTDEGSDLEEIKVEDDDSDSDESPPTPPRNRRSSVQKGQTVKIPAVTTTPIAPNVAEPPRESVIPVSKLVLCGGCGCRYFSETEAAISTIKKHGLHHKSQKVFPCRLCTCCCTSLEEMVEHVREHSQEPKFKDYVFFSPLDAA